MYDDLWNGPRGGARTWFSYLEADAAAWLEGLAEEIRVKGSEPFWRPVAAAFAAKFPAAPEANSDTIKNTVRRLVNQ